MNSNQTDTSKTLYGRHNLFFTLLGSFLILATFVAKDIINENLKDFISTISSATNTFILRQDTALLPNNRPTVMTAQSSGTQEELANYILTRDQQTESLIVITSDLAKVLDKSERNEADDRAKGLVAGITQIESDLAKAKGSQAFPRTQAELDSDTRNLVHQSNKANHAAFDFMFDVIKAADRLKEKRESSYRLGVRLSYGLFVLGWALTFYGQLSGKKPESNAEQA